MEKKIMGKIDLNEIAIEIRGLISERQKELSLTFVEDTHTYYMKDLKGIIKDNYPSVSKVLKNYYTEFPAETISLKKAKGCLVKQAELLTEWKGSADYATNMGSRVHYLLEDYLIGLYGKYKDVRRPIFECDDEQIVVSDNMVKAGNDYIKLMHERGAVLLDTEMILGDNELGYTGQPDKVWLILDKNGELGLVISDWKGLPLDTLIFTDNGWKTMGTVTKMDKVYDKDGNLVRIINISQVKNKKCLKMVFDNNEEIISDFEHRWLVYTEHNGKKKEMVMTTQEIKDYNDNLNKRTSNRILKIANPKPLNNCNTELPIDPYLLGMWLGDGHSDDAKITQANIKVWEEIRKRGYEIGNDVSQDGTGKATTRTIFGLQSNLRNLKLLRNKHVPEIYLHCSYEQRLDLLRGLMDSDGTYNKTRKRFVMVTTRESQAQYYIEVISSLGVKVTMIKYKKKFNGKIIPCYNVEFTTTNFNPFLCRNQDVILNPKTNKRLYRTIISVEDVDSVPTKCIEVDSTSSTFLCGKTFLVTHNTNKPKNFESHWYTKKMLAPFNSYDDTALIHYYLQLPLYIRLLLKMLENTKYKSIKYLGGIVVLLKEDSTYIEYRIPTDITNKVFKLEISC